jgi:hypothetical protein
VPLIFFVLSPAGYYYSFLMLLVLLPWHEDAADPVRLFGMGLLTLLGAAGYAMELLSADLLPLFYNASIQLGLFLLCWLGLEYLRIARRPRLAPEHVGV